MSYTISTHLVSQILFGPSRHCLCLNICHWYNKSESKLWRDITTFLFFVSHEKSIWENVFFFFFLPNLVGCGWEGLLRVWVVDNKWVMNVFRVWQVFSLSVCVCLFVLFFFFNYFTLCYWNSCYVVGIAYIHQL